MRRLIASLVVALSLGGASVSAAPVTIDTFDTPASAQTFIGPTGAINTSHSGTGILGTRTLTTSGALALGDVFSIGAGAFSAFTGTSAIETSLAYSSFGTQNFSGDLGINFHFSFLDAGVSATSTEVDVVLTTSTGTLTGSITLADSATAFSATLLFSSFTGPGSLSSVTGITVIFNNGGTPNQGTDFVLDGLSVTSNVPEPMSVALFGLTALSAVFVVRRKKQVPA